MRLTTNIVLIIVALRSPDKIIKINVKKNTIKLKNFSLLFKDFKFKKNKPNINGSNLDK